MWNPSGTCPDVRHVSEQRGELRAPADDSGGDLGGRAGVREVSGKHITILA